MTEKLTKVFFKPPGRSVEVTPGLSLMELISKLDLDFPSTCGGKGKCGKCRIVIEAGGEGLSPPSQSERQHLLPEEIEQGYRLACAISVPEVPLFSVRIPRVARAARPKLQVEGIEVPVTPDPVVKKYLVEVPAATLEDSRADEDKLLDALQKQHGLEGCLLDYEALKELPPAIEEDEGLVSCVLYNKSLILAVEAGDTTAQCFGFAVDIGTTKLAGFLMDLITGRQLASSSLTNPQALYGEDVMSRIAFTMNHKDGLAILQNIVVRAINDLIRDCCQQARVDSQRIYEACFVGNTCMTHLLLGVSPTSLAMFPYQPVLRKGISLRMRELPLRLSTHPNARGYVLPSIAGFVGADSVAVQLAASQLLSEKASLILDIGTNTEVVLTDKGGSMVCSCASGPAFEGMHITFGRKADSVSIDKVRINPETFEVDYKTIGGEKPAGICGSGIIDAMASMLKAGIIEPSGRMNDELTTPRVRKNAQGEAEFVLVWKDETDISSDIVVTQNDINEIQKAKAAIRAGCRLLMNQKGRTERDIDQLIIAGAFGQYIDKESARTIGMFPEIPTDRIESIGNAAGSGAKMALISQQIREQAERISQETPYYELALDSRFTEEYAQALFFPKD